MRESPAWVARHGLTAAEYQQAFDEVTVQGYRPVCVSGYAVGGEARYAAIWELRESPAWVARHGLTSSEYQRTVNQLSDLTIAKSHTGNFTQGQVGATYSITATNSGSAATSGTVTVTDTLPAGLTATAISGTGWTCVLGTLTCTRSDALAAGALSAPTRRQGLSLGDRACLALAQRLGATALTADRQWSQLKFGVSIRFLR